MDLDHPDDPVAQRWRFWQESPMPYDKLVVTYVTECHRDAVIWWLDFVEKTDREQAAVGVTAAVIRRDWFDACLPDPLTWEPTQQPPPELVAQLRQRAERLLRARER